MVSFSMDVSLDDVATAIEFSGDSTSERQEIMDFLIDVDRGMADLDWSVNLVTELAISTSEDMEAAGFADTTIVVNMPLPVPGLPDGAVNVPMALKVTDLIQGLAKQTPHLVVQVMANALFVQREAAAKAKANRDAESCGNCAHTRRYHHEDDGEALDCQDAHCMCKQFTEHCALTTCGHSMKNHNGLFPCAGDTRLTNCHPCAVADKEMSKP